MRMGRVVKTYWFPESTLYNQKDMLATISTAPSNFQYLHPLKTNSDARLTWQRGQDLLPGGGVESNRLRDADILAQEGRPGGRESLPEQRRARERSHCDEG